MRPSRLHTAVAFCANTPTILASSVDAVWNLGPIALDATTVYFGHGLFDDGSQLRDSELLARAKTGCVGFSRLMATSATPTEGSSVSGRALYPRSGNAEL